MILKDTVLNHYKKHPEMQIRDLLKFLYQGAFGCGHMVSDIDTVTAEIEKEYASVTPNGQPFTEWLSDNYCRLDLSVLSIGIKASTLGRLFCLSAMEKQEDIGYLEDGLRVVSELISHGHLPFSHEKFIKEATQWMKNGYDTLHHSEKFRSLYKPSYRVISKKFIPFLPLLAKIDVLSNKINPIIAIDGGSASGKTTLAKLLSEIYESTVFHMDDFFLTPEMKTVERLDEVGGNVDRERFEKEVLIPLKNGNDVIYRAYDCSVAALKEPITIKPRGIIIVEGAYSMHPQLSDYYDLSLFLDIDGKTQIKRIEKRNSPLMAKRFFNEWIPLENIYFEKTDIKNRCDLVITF